MTGLEHVPTLGVPRVATTTGLYLAEGPTWDPIRGRLLWVDIEDGCVYRGVLASDGTIEVEERIAFPGTAGTVAVAASGDLVVAGTHGLFFRTPDGSITAGPDVVAGDGRRFNDGKPDPAGRLVAGTKGPDGSVAETLLRFEPGGGVTVLDDDLTLANGLAWTADGRRLYTVDTLVRRIHVRDYDPDTGEVGPRTEFLDLAGILPDGQYPDGMTLDADDHLWVAVWGGGCVLRIAPDGRIVGRIDVPAPHTSSVAFAGAELYTMVLTTAQENLSADELARHPLSGRLFTLPSPVRGGRPRLWSGRR